MIPVTEIRNRKVKLLLLVSLLEELLHYQLAPLLTHYQLSGGITDISTFDCHLRRTKTAIVSHCGSVRPDRHAWANNYAALLFSKYGFY